MSLKRIPCQEFTLSPETELRFEVEGKNIVSIELQQGLAEIFGREIVLGLVYEFKKGSKIAVFTWHGCKVKLCGLTEYSYISKETPLVQYLNVHCGLEQKRNTAERKNRLGPVTMIVGAHDVGKSTLSRILLNYAVRTGHRKPIFVDLDVEDNHLSMPGSISALSVERPLSYTSGFSEAALVFHFGHTKINANPGLYTALVNQMAETIKQKLEKQMGSQESGVIINTGSYVRKEGYEHLSHIASAFNVNLILVLDNESLHHFLKKDERMKKAQIVPIQKNGGVIQRTEHLRFESLDTRIREYFYGQDRELYPFSIQLPFKETKLWRLGGKDLPESYLPLGMSLQHRQMQMVSVAVSASLVHYLVAMCYPRVANSINGKKSSGHAPSAVEVSVRGYLCITGVDTEREVLTVLSVHPSPLPPAVMLLSSVQFYDQ